MAAALGALMAGCGGGQNVRKSAERNQCRAAIGFEGATHRPLGRQQLVFAQQAVATDNARNHTKISLVVADTERSPSLAATATDQFVSRPKIVAVIGPASNAEVAQVGPTFARAGTAFVSGSATGSALTKGANPTFFRIVPEDSLQGPQEARFVLARLHPRAVMIVADQSGFSRQFLASMLPTLRAARVAIDRQVVTERSATPASIVARVARPTPLVILAWQAPSDAQQFGRALLQQRKTVTILGPDRLYAPGTFTVPGAYVPAYGPDITALPADASIVRQVRRSLPSFGTGGPPSYAAAHVIDQAIASVCKAGQAPSRGAVLAAIRATHERSSILGIPIRFRPDGDLSDARWFLYRVNSAGAYRPVTNS